MERLSIAQIYSYLDDGKFVRCAHWQPDVFIMKDIICFKQDIYYVMHGDTMCCRWVPDHWDMKNGYWEEYTSQEFSELNKEFHNGVMELLKSLHEQGFM